MASCSLASTGRAQTRENHPVDLRRAPRIGVDDRDGAIAPRGAELGEKMPPITAVAAIGRIIGLEPVEMAVPGSRHLVFDISAKACRPSER